LTFLSLEFIVLIGILYISLLFYIAYKGDQTTASITTTHSSDYIYSLSLAVYCSSWTFFGAVGSAVNNGWSFFAIYLGPILLFLFGHRLIKRIISISKQYKITSIADFLSSRYGKSRRIAIAVSIIATIGALPYISLQLEAINLAFSTISQDNSTTSALTSAVDPANTANYFTNNTVFDSALTTAIVLAIFSILFGTRHLDTTEHHRGMIYAIAFESLIKLLAILLVGFFAIKLLVDFFNNGNFSTDALHISAINKPIDDPSGFWIEFVTRTFLSITAILLLPRQFQVMAVEAESHQQMDTARWLFPIYLLLISLLVIPIAIAGSQILGANTNPDLFVLSLPLSQQQNWLAIIAYIGGLSAATGMVIVATISLSTMLCNDIVMPFLFRLRPTTLINSAKLPKIILAIRRITIILLLLGSYGFLQLYNSTNSSLANMGLLSFAAIAQLSPALFAGLFWQQANQRGAFIGLLLGFITWTYCLLLPNFIATPVLDSMFVNLTWLHPQHLFNFHGVSSLTHGVIWSILFNILGLIVGSLSYKPNTLDRIQASVFRHAQYESTLAKNAIEQKVSNVKDAKHICNNILGVARTAQLFSQLENQHDTQLTDHHPINQHIIEEIERAIAAVIGASSARHIIVTQLLSDSVSAEDLFVMMDKNTQALQFSQELLQASFDNINQGISVVDNQLKLVAWNSQYQKMFNYSDDLLKVGMPVEQLLQHTLKLTNDTPQEHENIIKKRLKNLQSNTTYRSESALNDGRYIQSTGNPIPGVGFITSFTDITEQKNAEIALRASEQQIRLYADNLPLMLCYVDTDLRVKFSNQAYNRFLQKTADEIQNQHITDVMGDRLLGERLHFINRALAGEKIQFRTGIKDQTGETTHYQINYIPDRTNKNTTEQTTNIPINGYFAIYQDITETVKATELLRRINEKLEERVAARTQELEGLNRQLQEENETTRKLSAEIEAVTRSKTRFLAAASHDLLQPINAARLFTNSLILSTDQQPAPETNRIDNAEILSKIDGSLVNADKLLRALLDISKLDTGKLEPEIIPFKIQTLFEELRTDLTPSAELKGLELIFAPCKRVIQSDRTLLRSVLQNLIINAIRYTQKGKVLVGCRLATHTLQAEKAIEIQVNDTGIGINKADQQRIFVEFQRLQDSQTQKHDQGLGLGLAIVQRISQILEHPIKVTSVYGKGSKFSVTVPLYSGKLFEVEKTRQWQSQQNIAGLRILCLENTPDVLEAMKTLLEQWQCQVLTASNYDEAMQHYHNSAQTEQNGHLTFDIVLADYRLDDDRTGLDFLQFLDEEQQLFSAILVTAEQEDAIKITCRDFGYNFLAKPVDPLALRNILQRVSALHRRLS
jgi:PAS domain S-box-containing protein